jgi:hypothetical protein
VVINSPAAIAVPAVRSKPSVRANARFMGFLQIGVCDPQRVALKFVAIPLQNTQCQRGAGKKDGLALQFLARTGSRISNLLDDALQLLAADSQVQCLTSSSFSILILLRSGAGFLVVDFAMISSPGASSLFDSKSKFCVGAECLSGHGCFRWNCFTPALTRSWVLPGFTTEPGLNLRSRSLL